MQRKTKLRWIAAISSLPISYGLSFAMVWENPYWEDNGVLEFIDWEDRWGWAFTMTPVFLVLVWFILILWWVLVWLFRCYQESRR